MRLSEADRERLRAGFLSKFPGVDLHSGNLPSLAYLQLIMSQRKGGVWSWTPWRKILSEAAVNEVKGRKKESKRGELLDLLAQTAGIDDSEWDLDLPSAPYKVFLILQVRAHAFVMVGGGHLATWMGYINKFMGHYQRKVGLATRAPSASEAEEADRTVLSEVFRMVFYDGYTLDDALGVVCEEDLLRCHLIPLPKLVLKPAVNDQPPIKRKRVADEKGSGAEKKSPVSGHSYGGFGTLQFLALMGRAHVQVTAGVSNRIAKNCQPQQP